MENLKHVTEKIDCLSKKRQTIIEEIDDFKFSETEYFGWYTNISKSNAELHTKIMKGMDTHYQLEKDLNLKDYPKGDYSLLITTGDKNMWDTDNPQMIVLVDDKIIRALDTNHNKIELPQKDKINLKINIYLNKEKSTQMNCKLIKENKLVVTLFYKIKNLYETILVLDDNNEKQKKIIDFLNKILKIVRFESNSKLEFERSIKTAIQYFDENISMITGREELIEHCVGHTHIDVSWLWGIKQTEEKVVRSFSNILYLMEKYPKMTFMSSQPILYKMLKKREPNLYKKVKKLVDEGRWEVEGSMFLESDVNIPSGESLIRQIIKGKQFFKKEFNKENKILWLPDVFGYTPSLPQIMRKSNINYFFTSKIDWNDTNRLPNDTFYWKGIDGSKILTHFLTTSDFDLEKKKGTTYNGRMNASQIRGTWERYQNKNLSNDTLQIYGFGDGGGGPTDEMLENFNIFEHGIDGMPKTVHSTAQRFFNVLENNIKHKNVPSWTGELYLENHRGVYTTDSRLKKYNRLAENELLSTEILLFITEKYINKMLDFSSIIDEAWEELLINHFHDIVTGTSIEKVHYEAEKRYKFVLKTCSNIKTKIFSLWSGLFKEGILLFNTTSFERDFLIEQSKNDFEVRSIPAFGYKFISNKTLEELDNKKSENVLTSKIDDLYYEYCHYILKFNNKGELTRLFSKENNFEYIDQGNYFNQLVLFEDTPKEYDAWNIERAQVMEENPIINEAKINIEKNTELETILSINRRFSNSSYIQKIYLYKNSKRIDFKTKIDWQETQKLLKVKFSTNINSMQSSYETQFGYIQRNTYENTSWDEAKFEVFGHRWIDLSDKSLGLAVLNDSKYGFRIFENNMYISLLRNPSYPYANVDKGEHEFIYSLLPHMGDVSNENIYKEAISLNSPIVKHVVNMDIETKNEGSILSEQHSLIDMNKSNIIIESIKRSENKEGYIVRLFESVGKTTNCLIQFNFPVLKLSKVNLVEELLKEKKLQTDNKLMLRFSPFEIKSLYIE